MSRSDQFIGLASQGLKYVAYSFQVDGQTVLPNVKYKCTPDGNLREVKED